MAEMYIGYATRYNNPGQALPPMDAENEGRVVVINDQLFFSPNCRRKPEYISNPIDSFDPKLMSAEDFQQPRWWKEETEWLGFVPRMPVPWSGVLLDMLTVLPRWAHRLDSGEYQIYRKMTKEWSWLEGFLHHISRLLVEKNHLKCLPPFLPSAFGYHKPYATHSEALQGARKARDWFSLWIGLLYWITRKIPDPKLVEGITCPIWHQELLIAGLESISLEALRCSRLLQRAWNANRVGVVLRIPEHQPNLEWFLLSGVPVWYPWNAETQQSNWPKPTAAQVQEATTWLYSSPAFSTPDAGHTETTHWAPSSPVLTSARPCSSVPHVDLLPQQDQSRDLHVSDKGETSKNSHLQQKKSARDFWEPFFKKREEQNAKRRARETEKERQIRESRERQPPRTSAPVYVWDWSDDNPNTFTRTLVRRDQRAQTLEEFSGEQKRYDSFRNEWNCCVEWGPSLPVSYDEYDDSVHSADDELDASGTIIAGETIFNMKDSEMHNIFADAAEQEILELLVIYFGFVPPLPVPQTSDIRQEMADRQSLIAVLGLPWLKHDNPFFEKPLGKICTDFLRHFSSKTPHKPHDDFWDLNPSNRQSIISSRRLSCIRAVANREGQMYMFDFGNKSTVPWKIAVDRATIAVYICRINDNLDETEIAFELVRRGIPFRTLQERRSLAPVVANRPVGDPIPMRISNHTFCSKDFKFYLRASQEILSIPRGRAALLRGGFVGRLATDTISKDEALRGPTGLHQDPDFMFSVWDDRGVQYADDDLSTEELEILSGTYIRYTGHGDQISKVSWWPPIHIYENSGEDKGWWHGHAEQMFIKRQSAALIGRTPTGAWEPLSPAKWRERMRGYPDSRRAFKQLEAWSREFLQQGTVD